MAPPDSYPTALNRDDTGNDGTRQVEVKAGFTGDRTDPKHGAAAGRMPAFIGLARQAGGFYVENGDGLTIDDALTRAGLNFTVDLHEFEAVVGEQRLPGPSRLRTVVGTWPNGDRAALGVAGKGWFPLQPAAVAAFGQSVLDEGGASIVAAGRYGDPLGARMYLAFKMPTGIKVGGSDPHDMYLTLGSSFNRESGLWGLVAPIRVKCTNQTTATFFGSAPRFSIPHTKNMELRIQDVRAALELTGTFAEQYARASEVLLRASMRSRVDLDAFLEKVFPTPAEVKTERGEDNWRARRHQVRTLITESDTCEFGRGTRYGVLQGVFEYIDHLAPAHSPAGRYARLLDGGPGEKTKERAAELLMAGV